MKVALELPLPPPELSPNARVAWPLKARASRDYRADCGWRARLERDKHGRLASPIDARITFIFPDRRRRDHDNALASIKAGIDGIVDSGLIPGDDAENFRIVAVTFTDVKTANWRPGPPAKPCVRVELIEQELRG